MRKIPDYIIDDETRMKLAEINEHLRDLQDWHRRLMEKAHVEKLSKEESDLLNEIIKSHNSLQKRFQDLTPSLVDISSRYRG